MVGLAKALQAQTARVPILRGGKYPFFRGHQQRNVRNSKCIQVIQHLKIEIDD